jgi:hypothetical protein
MIVREWREKPELTDFSWGVTEKVVRHARDELLVMRAPCLCNNLLEKATFLGKSLTKKTGVRMNIIYQKRITE